jgi:excisionase family DNA binding protein
MTIGIGRGGGASPSPFNEDDRLLTPREVAELFGVATATIAGWARAGKLPFRSTPGGHRRYRLRDLKALLPSEPTPDELQLEIDAARLYAQGWSIRRVAAEFDRSYGSMRRIFRKHVTLREPHRAPSRLP